MMIINILSAPLLFLLGAQVEIRELRLLTGNYNYPIQKPQWVTFGAFLLALFVLVGDILVCGNIISFVGAVFSSLILYAILEWTLAVTSPQKLIIPLLFRMCYAIVMAFVFSMQDTYCLAPFLLTGLYFRNAPFGVVFGKPFFLAYRIHRTSSADHVQLSVNNREHTHIDVTQHGIRPDTNEDVLEAVQRLIDKVGREGGGCIYFPKGRYLFNKSGKKDFIQINYSHITLEGETGDDGHLLTEWVNCGCTVNGKQNPWLSPFFITTGEALQPSNQFWGLDFKKPSHIRMESSSLSDPGSDGKLLTPPYATIVTATAKAGSCMLEVADSRAVGKYVMLGLYNTSADGNLIKELLGVKVLRPEWKNALRAGVEEAPSFQWLVEVKRVVDAHTIELCTPLVRDCPLKYSPALFNAELLEDIHIRHISIASQWNGLFHHHGVPLYYSTSKAQEMDYGWNAINMKRTAHSGIEHVVIKDFTNPIYIQDSLNVCTEHVAIKGYDGHQGIKVYCHTCNCVFNDIVFHAHFADMMGGEGNAYGNIFTNTRYVNPVFNPVDFDFHGFSEGPMSPPAYNVFEQITGFRYIKGAGAVFNLPACATNNTWRNIVTEGERKGECIFYALSYRVKSGTLKWATAQGFSLIMILKKRKMSFVFFRNTFREKLQDIDYMSVPRSQHAQFFPNCQLENIHTWASYSD